MSDWRVPALPNTRFEPTPRACMLTPEVVEITLSRLPGDHYTPGFSARSPSWANEVPHLVQKVAFGLTSAPQLGQSFFWGCGASACPHCMQ
jgi:hypothetical protein